LAHTGIRLRIVIAGAGPVLEGDSDWLHMMAVYASCSTGDLDPLDAALARPAFEAEWHQVMGGPVEVWVQPVILPDAYPDDEQPDEWTGDLPEGPD
jgi:hypothetical protein